MLEVGVKQPGLRVAASKNREEDYPEQAAE
jgi:hypothetical protein